MPSTVMNLLSASASCSGGTVSVSGAGLPSRNGCSMPCSQGTVSFCTCCLTACTRPRLVACFCLSGTTYTLSVATCLTSYVRWADRTKQKKGRPDQLIRTSKPTGEGLPFVWWLLTSCWLRASVFTSMASSPLAARMPVLPGRFKAYA